MYTESGSYTVTVTVQDDDGGTSSDASSVSVALDRDGDGVNDEVDPFPNSDTSPTVIIDGADTGVANLALGDGSTFNDQISECADGARNHGQFVSCLNGLTNDWRRAGLIDNRDRSAITRAAAQSGAGKK